MALPPHFVTTETEYYYLITIARRHITSTRDGVVRATPGEDTRQTLVQRALEHALAQIGLTGDDNFTMTSVYLEPNEL
jgi:hypothetical protein